MVENIDLAIIGGSSLSNIEGMSLLDEVDLDTPFGKPSEPVKIIEYKGKKLAFLSRHGSRHEINPTNVNYRANIWALKSLGVKDIITFSATGSLREEMAPEHFCVPDQLIDRTTNRIKTFFDSDIVVHVSGGYLFDEHLRNLCTAACMIENVPVHEKGTYVAIEGPQFSSRAESLMYRQWGGDLIGMTGSPEAKLAREAEIAYCTVAQITDYDSWNVTSVSQSEVDKHVRNNITNVQKVLKRILDLYESSEIPKLNVLDGAVMTSGVTLDNCPKKYELLLRGHIS